jgi:outer membrane protein assembly factor BamB
MRIAFSLPLAAAVLLVAQPIVAAKDSWPQWRGAAQNGVASGNDFPTIWSEDSRIAWKTDLVGNGGSTPVIGRSAAYITSGVDGRNVLLAFNIDTGQLSWQVDLGQDTGAKHRKGSGSNPSAVVDGDRVFAYFRSGDLACVDTRGNVLWKSNLQDQYGEDTLWWDLGSQPAVVSVNELADNDPYTVASPVPLDQGGLLLRTRHRLYRIGEK